MMKGKVFLVGAGPGDKDLITVKGLNLLSQADAILYDHLIPHELLAFSRPDAERISVGKYSSSHTLSQSEINQLLIEKANEGKRVVRLKGGDCYLFGRGGEEAEACGEAGIEFEVVPGVTSALAAPCYAGIPPTHRDYTSSVAIVTGHRKQGDPRPVEIPRAGTVILLMSAGNIENVIASLLAAGYPPETAMAAVEHGTCYDQRVVTGTVGTFLDTAGKEPLRTPVIFVAGDVVGLRAKLDWFSKKPRILHLGSHPERYAHLGTIVHRPIIQCIEAQDSEPLTKSIRRARDFDWLVFTSANAIQFFFKKLLAVGQDVRAFANTKFAVIGKASASRLMQFGVKADLCPELESSRGLLDQFSSLPVEGVSFLLPQSEISSNELFEGLTHRGARVEALDLYRTVELQIEDVDFAYIDRILFTSGSTVRAYVKQFGSVPSHIQALCLGIPTQTVARQHDIDAEIISADAD